MFVTWLFTRKSTATQNATALASREPIVGQTRVTQAQLGQWHREHGDAVKNWIENHEAVLQKVSDGGLAIDLAGDLTAGHEALSASIDDAIARHPAPQMRAQLSALVQASRNTIESLKRSNWTNAEREHVAYLEHRDTWLDRLRQFTNAETTAQDSAAGSQLGASSARGGHVLADDTVAGAAASVASSANLSSELLGSGWLDSDEANSA